MPDPGDWLYDPRLTAPEPEDYTWQPEPGEERAYYEADEGAECPVCHLGKPHHGRGCWIAGEADAGWRRSIASYSEELPWVDR